MKIVRNTVKKASSVIILTLCTTITVHATQYQNKTSITEAITEFVLQQDVPLKNVQITLTSSTKRLRLVNCLKPLQVTRVAGAKLIGHTNLVISCSYPKQWKKHVALHIDGKVDVLVARHPIIQRTLIEENDLKFSSRLYSQLNYGYYESANKINNMEARRNIKTGQVITPGLLNAQKLVLRGQHITIIAQNAGLTLRVKGKSLMDGQQGQTIRVKNLTSNKLIYARVISAGTVKVNF